MAKLHELLAVEDNLKGQAAKVRTELTETFQKRQLFEETRKTYTDNAEGSAPVVEEQKDIQSTVADQIKWVCGHLAKALDLGYQVDVGDTMAKADVVTEEDETLLHDVPTTALLRLGHRLREIQTLIEAIPTLDPVKGFQPDPDRGPGIYKAREVVKPRTRKTNKVITLAPPTDKFPAQVQLVQVDEATGTIREQEWSAMVTPAVKAELLARVEMLYRAVTRARARANHVDLDVSQQKIGKTLLDWLFQPLTKLG